MTSPRWLRAAPRWSAVCTRRTVWATVLCAGVVGHACGGASPSDTRGSAALQGPGAASTVGVSDADGRPGGPSSADAWWQEGVERLADVEGIRTVLVARERNLIVERYVRGGDGAVNIKSASKSILSALVGIAIEEGHLEGTDQRLETFFPGIFRRSSPSKRRMTVHHLLSMTAGLESTSGEHYGAWVGHDDWVRAALDRPVVAAPGRRFIYSTGNTHVLSAVLAEATGRSTREYAEDVLFEPLGIRVHGWQQSPRGIHMGGNNLSMTPRDMLRFGRLYLQGGEWAGKRVVPSSWVARSTRRQADGWPERYGAYGYLWWLPPEGPRGTFMAVGFGGQFIIVAPASETVVVVTSSARGKSASWDRRLLDLVSRHFLGVAG